MMAAPTLRVKAMRSKLMQLCRWIAGYLRRFAEWLDPTPETPVDRLMPMAREVVASLKDSKHAGPIKWLLAMKTIEKATKARRRYINAAIDRAVLEYGD